MYSFNFWCFLRIINAYLNDSMRKRMTQILSTCTPLETFMLKPQLKLRSTGEHHQKKEHSGTTDTKHTTGTTSAGRASPVAWTTETDRRHFRPHNQTLPTINQTTDQIHYETKCFIVHFSIVRRCNSTRMKLSDF